MKGRVATDHDKAVARVREARKLLERAERELKAFRYVGAQADVEAAQEKLIGARHRIAQTRLGLLDVQRPTG